MFFVPLSQEDSVRLLVHCLKAAAGEADCTMCPAYRVCMKQCLTIAGSVEQMLLSGTLPQIGDGRPEGTEPPTNPDPPAGGAGARGRLKVVK
jgi:hypothetical protein